jgi:hypothetical protein
VVNLRNQAHPQRQWIAILEDIDKEVPFRQINKWSISKHNKLLQL